MENKKMISLRVDADTRELLKKYSTAWDKSQSEVVATALKMIDEWSQEGRDNDLFEVLKKLREAQKDIAQIDGDLLNALLRRVPSMEEAFPAAPTKKKKS